MATGIPCCSPWGAPTTTVPRLRPRRAKRGPEPSDQPQGHARRPVLLADGQRPGLPATADRVQGRGHHVEEHLGRLGARGQSPLDDRPRPGLVPVHQTGLQAPPGLGPGGPAVDTLPTPAGRRGVHGRSPGSDPPLGPDLHRRQPAGADPAVDGHVVHALELGRLVEAEPESAGRSGRQPGVAGTGWVAQPFSSNPRGCPPRRRRASDGPGSGPAGPPGRMVPVGTPTVASPPCEGTGPDDAGHGGSAGIG